MSDVGLVFIVLGAVFAGVVFTLLVLVGTSIRAMTRDAREATRRVSELAALTKPIVVRVDRLSRVVEESESDVAGLSDLYHIHLARPVKSCLDYLLTLLSVKQSRSKV